MRLRDFVPKNAIDGLAMGFTFIMIPVAYLHGVFYVAPTIWPISDVPDQLREENLFAHYANVLWMTFLFVNGVSNLIVTITTDSSCSRIALPVVSQPGWVFCPFCQYYAPPRSHHCPTCRRCVLRRDHHCYFAGKCVGYYNHRYFIGFLIYVSVAAVYGTVLSFRTISILMGGLHWGIIPAMVFPVLGWLLQIMPVNALVMIETSTALFVMFGAGGLLLLQVLQICKGQTFWEFKRKTVRYNHGFSRNFADVMGTNWWFCWLSPFIPSPRLGDGSHYPSLDAPQHRSNSSHAQHGPLSDGQRKMEKRL